MRKVFNKTALKLPGSLMTGIPIPAASSLNSQTFFFNKSSCPRPILTPSCTYGLSHSLAPHRHRHFKTTGNCTIPSTRHRSETYPGAVLPYGTMARSRLKTFLPGWMPRTRYATAILAQWSTEFLPTPSSKTTWTTYRTASMIVSH